MTPPSGVITCSCFRHIRRHGYACKDRTDLYSKSDIITVWYRNWLNHLIQICTQLHDTLRMNRSNLKLNEAKASFCMYQTSDTLRSPTEKLLKIPKRNSISLGECSLSFVPPPIWNSLPTTLRNIPAVSEFKTQLKTLFSLDRPFYKPRQTIPVTIDYVHMYVYRQIKCMCTCIGRLCVCVRV